MGSFAADQSAAPTVANPDDVREYERLRQEMFETWGRLARSGLDIDMLRKPLLMGQILTPSKKARDEFDQVRLELDAYLRSIADGEAAVKPTDDFVPSREVSGEEVEEVVTALFGVERERESH